jgi:putative methyltransferase (TIGR04325 family)
MLWNWLRKLAAFPWKTFDSWGSAVAFCASYENDVLNRFRVARDELNRSNSRIISLEDNALLWVCSLLTGELSVTDFGGATGEFGEALMLSRPAVKYTVVENPALVAALDKKSSSIRFCTDIPSECDVFFTSSSLQYVEDPFGVLAIGFKSARQAVILVRNNFADRDVIRVQASPLFNNGGGAIPAGFKNTKITYPVRTISESRVRAIAAEAGFKLIARVPEEAEGLAFLDNCYSAQLVFIKLETIR